MTDLNLIHQILQHAYDEGLSPRITIERVRAELPGVLDTEIDAVFRTWLDLNAADQAYERRPLQ